MEFGDKEFFDTPERGIENAARELLAKLEKANASEDTTPIEL